MHCFLSIKCIHTQLSEVTQEIVCGTNSSPLVRRRRSLDELTEEHHRSKRTTDPQDSGK